MRTFLTAAVLCFSAGRVQAQPPPPVRAVRLHAYPYSSSTLIGVDTFQLRYSAPLKTRIQHPSTFVARLDAALARRDTLPRAEFRDQFVRFYFAIRDTRGCTRAVYVAQGRTLLNGRRLYRLDDELKTLLRAYLPRPDEFLPMHAAAR